MLYIMGNFLYISCVNDPYLAPFYALPNLFMTILAKQTARKKYSILFHFLCLRADKKIHMVCSRHLRYKPGSSVSM